jgi:2-polyprenyl-6-methoxyphenol hydroxylase-like FAD-dependent oxidoreductase
LHADSGQLALRKAGLLESFLSEARCDAQRQRVIDHATGTVLHERKPPAGTAERPEIDRLRLRQLLLRPLSDDTVRWNARVTEVVAASSGRHRLALAGERTDPFDLVIGADGTWSRTRTALTATAPSFSGVTFAELRLIDVQARHAELAELVGPGTLFSLHDGIGIFAQRNGNNVIRVYAALRAESPRSLADITRQEILSRFEGWAPALRALIAQADKIVAARPIMALPPDFRWPTKAGVTLIGDAAHVMPPLGVGVNLALLDAADLAGALTTEGNWQEATSRQEATMMARANICAMECMDTFAEWFGAADAQAVVANLQKHA